MIKAIRKLKTIGVLGINKRNAEYTLIYNPRKKYPLVDDKLITKLHALKAGIAVPELYASIEIQHQVRELESNLQKHNDFVIKPSRGSGGEGIIVISSREGKTFQSISGNSFTLEDLEDHCYNILGGMYSLGGQPDKVLIEYRVKFDQTFESVTYRGVPDIRIILFLGVPVMAMIRLPTKESDGKANLHQGAIGAGISIKSGKTLSAVWHNKVISNHPDTGNPIGALVIPKWDELLALASSCFDLSGLGYQAVDIVLDRNLGPLILELNARPGLNIQIANREGLTPRLEFVKVNAAKLTNVAERVAFARFTFN